MTLINTDDIKNEKAPAQDFPLNKGEPYFIPTIAAKQSETIKTNHEVIANPFEKSKQLTKKPRAM